MTLNTTNPGEIDSGSLTTILSRRDALERVQGIYGSTSAQALYDSAQDAQDLDLMEAIENRAIELGWDLVKGGTGTEAGKARGLLVDLMNVVVTAPGQVREAASYKNPNFTADAIAKTRTARITDTVSTLAAEATSITAQIAALSTKADARAAAVAPKLDLTDMNQLARTAQTWQLTIAPVLDRGGVDWGRLLNALDFDGLLAVQRFLPQWVSTQPRGTNLPDLDDILNGVSQRLPATASDPRVAALLSNANQVRFILAQAEGLTQSISGVKSSNDADLMTGIVQRASVAAGVTTSVNYPTPAFNKLS